MSDEHFDVLIIGAGLSGIGAAYYLQTRCPGKSFAILESRESIGGTWDLFRYPGVRSDSDMYTLGFRFRPWRGGKSIADGAAILEYIRDTAEEFGVDRKIRFSHRATRASWSSSDSLWTVEAETAAGESVRFTCGFLYMCSGYYEYERGYTPELPGIDRFAGPVVHPQEWPEDLEYSDKRVVVIGSGATAVTLVPAMAKEAREVIMLQRSPTYVVARPARDRLADRLLRVLPDRVVHPIVRWKNVLLGIAFFQLARKKPEYTRRLIRAGVQKHLGSDYDVDTHFNPRYDPWDQRLCLVPDADLFEAVRAGNASIFTGRIATITESGVELETGEHLDADIIITATGLNMRLMGGMELVVDGETVDVSGTMNYKGMMFSDVPNLAYAFGYTNASWTLKCELTAEYVCRLLNHMDSKGYTQCVPRPDPTVSEEPAISFTSGYVQRALERLPSQGSRRPWRINQNYVLDLLDLRFSRVEDSVMEFSGSPSPASRRGGTGGEGREDERVKKVS